MQKTACLGARSAGFQDRYTGDLANPADLAPRHAVFCLLIETPCFYTHNMV